MWTPSTGYKPFHQVRQGLGKGFQSKHPKPSSLNAVARLARKAPASQVEIVRKRQWMSPAPPKNRKPPPAQEPGPAKNSLGKRQRGKGKRWDAKTEVRRFERRKPTRTGLPPFRVRGGRGRGRSRGLSFVSRGEALRRGLTAGSWTGVGVAMTSPARPQMPPAEWAPVGRSPQDSIAAAARGDCRAGRGAATCPGPEAGARGLGWDNGALLGRPGGCPGTWGPRPPPWGRASRAAKGRKRTLSSWPDYRKPAALQGRAAPALPGRPLAPGEE